MKPKSQASEAQLQLFQAHFDQILNPDHPLVVLANKIDWPRFDAALEDCYCPDNGAPGKAVRLMVGLHYLKHAFNESDESVVARWIENPYWQLFCGFTTMQHELPLHPTVLAKWRNNVALCCGNRTYVWPKRRRSRQVDTHTQNNSNECVENYED